MHDQSMNQLSKVNNYTGCVSANARSHRLCRVIVEMGTATSFINIVSGWPYSYCRYMQKLLKHNFLCRCPSKIIATIQAIIIFMCVLFDVRIHVYMHNVCTILARYYAPFVYKHCEIHQLDIKTAHAWGLGTLCGHSFRNNRQLCGASIIGNNQKATLSALGASGCARV